MSERWEEAFEEAASGFAISGPQASLTKFLAGHEVTADEARADTTIWRTEVVSEAVYDGWNALVRQILTEGEKP